MYWREHSGCYIHAAKAMTWIIEQHSGRCNNTQHKYANQGTNVVNKEWMQYNSKYEMCITSAMTNA